MSEQHNAYFKNNIKWLQKNLPVVAANLLKCDEASVPASLAQDECGWNCNVEFSKRKFFYLHSKWNRDREYENILKGLTDKNTTVVFFGSPDISLLTKMKNEFPLVRHLILIEPNPKVFAVWLQQGPIQELVGIFPKVSLVINKTNSEMEYSIKQALATSTLENKAIAFIGIVNYCWQYQEMYKGIYNALVEAIRFSRVNYNTLKAFRELWMVNLWHNLQYGDADARDFAPVFKGKPAVIVSAGPSLDKNIHLLEAAKEKAVIVAVGSAISILKAHNIVPHFHVAIDPGQDNDKLFTTVNEDNVPLLYSTHLYFKALEQYKGPKVHVTLESNSALEKHLYKLADLPIYSVASGFSVANVAANILTAWECNPVVFVGQDLAYTEDRLHAQGSWDKEIEQKYIKKTFLRKDIFGGDVYTDPAFEGMREIFERIISANPQLQYLNATEGGVKIEGAPNKTLQEVLDSLESLKPTAKEEIDAVLAALAPQDLLEQRKNQLASAVQTYKISVENMIALIDRELPFIESLLRRESPPDHGEAKRVAKAIKHLQKQDVYLLLSPVFEEGFRIRREGYLQQAEMENVLPQVKLFYLEINEVKEFLFLQIKVLGWYERGEEFNVVFE